MYNGWLEIGGNLMYSSSFDVVLRTNTNTSKIAIGNGDNAIAGIYMQSNNVGIQTLPRYDYGLTVHPKSLFIDTSTYSNNVVVNGKMNGITKISSTAIDLYNNTSNVSYFSTNGISRSRMLVGDVVKTITTEFKIQGARVFRLVAEDIINIDGGTIRGYRLTLDSIYSDQIPVDSIVLITRQAFQIRAKNIVNGLVGYGDRLFVQIDMVDLYADQGYPNFNVNDMINIEFLSDVASTTSGDITIMYKQIQVTACTYNDNGTFSRAVAQVTVNVENPGSDFFKINMYYSLKTSITEVALDEHPKVLLLLTDISNVILTNTSASIKTFILTFLLPNKRDAMEPILEAFISSSSLYIFPVISLQPPQNIVEYNVIAGYASVQDKNYKLLYLSDTNLVDNSSLYDTTGPSQGLEYIMFDNQVRIVNEHFLAAKDASVALDVGIIDELGFVIMRRNIQYSYVGTPIIIKSATLLAYDTIQYTFDCTFIYAFDVLKEFINKYVYVIDCFKNAIWQLGDVAIIANGTKTLTMKMIDQGLKQSYSSLEQISTILQNRVIYIVPFKFITLNILGDTDNLSYISSSLGIGTTNVKERLTVNGTASFKDAVMVFNDTSTVPLTLTYSSNVFRISDRVTMAGDKATFLSDVWVNGDVTAREFYRMSDERLKTNIAPAESIDDLERISRLQFKTFEMIMPSGSVRRPAKGVIAHEVEEIYPEAVYKESGMIYFMGPLSGILHSNTLTIDISQTSQTVLDHAMQIIAPFVYVVVAHPMIGNIALRVESVRDSMKQIVLDPNSTIPETKGRVMLVCVKDDVYKVNYEYLYVSAMNAIKVLNERIQYISNVMSPKSNNT